MISYSKNIKKELCDIGTKMKICCGYSILYGLLYAGEVEEEKATIKMLNSDVGAMFIGLCKLLNIKADYCYRYHKNKIEINKSFLRYEGFDEIKKNIFRCGKCKEFFLRGLFLSIGGISDPEKSYRLELIFTDADKMLAIKEFLATLGMDALCTVRNDKHIIYFRRSEAIEDLFANIGATSLAFDIMNSKINKELINNANRVTNCDAANINKSLKATNKYINVINELIEQDKLNMLPDHLKDMAKKRIEHKELSFADLGNLFLPPISKSGVYHRLEKIVEFYEEIKEKN